MPADLQQLVSAQNEGLDDVHLSSPGHLNANSIGQHEAAQVVAAAHGHLGGDPASHPQAQHIDGLGFESRNEIQIQISQVVDTVDGLAALRGTEPRMGGGQHRKSRCQGRMIRLPLGHHFAIVQHQQGGPLSAAIHL